jgi:hypothetical protein
MIYVDLRDEVVGNLLFLVVVFVVVAAPVEVYSPPPRSPWQINGSDMICRMLRWTLRKERSLMQTVLADVAFLLVPLAAENDAYVGRCVSAPGRKSEFKNERAVCEAVEGG